MKRLISKSFAILVGFLSGLSLSWSIGAAMSSLMVGWNPLFSLVVKLLFCLPILAGIYLAIRADLSQSTFKELLAREAALIGLSVWGGLLGLTLFLGGLNKVMPLLVPVVALAIAALYLLCVGLIVGKIPLSLKPTMRWLLLLPSVLLLTFIPLIFEFVSQAAGYTKPKNETIYSQLILPSDRDL
jgi:hypothetical protein